MTGGTGFIGLGIMGEGMAARLVSQGVAGQSADTPLVVWNRTPSKCQDLQAKFPNAHIVIVESAAAVVQQCTITYSMLSTPEASAAVFEAEKVGTLAGVSPGKAIVDCATLAEADMQRMNTAVTAKGG
jgi:3-hydroxyisobutyrate dehydrogenase-like beta-hydroxyacid dehydrogenase